VNDTPEAGARPLARALGVASAALAVPMLASPRSVARLVGVDDVDVAPQVIEAVGVREVLHALTLLTGSPRNAWTRVAGDALDLTLLGRALAGSRGDRRTKVSGATAAVAGLAVLDTVAAIRSRHSGQHGRGRPGPLALVASVTVRSSPQEVYSYWRDFENLPRFMGHLRSVTVDGQGRSTWTAEAPIRRQVTWQAEMTGDEPGRRISWKSLPGSDIANSGTVHFAETPDGTGTEVRVRLHYDVPGGAIGRVVARVWGEEPSQQVHDDLRRFKALMETGDIVRSDAMPDGVDSGHQMSQRPAQPVKAAPQSAGRSARSARRSARPSNRSGKDAR
jgi:uncharacterized membrane protein